MISFKHDNYSNFNKNFIVQFGNGWERSKLITVIKKTYV